jgi:hypothetical protein
MKPFILEFTETPIGESPDYNLVEYDNSLNLSVHKETRQPAIEIISMETETFTKTQGEGADSDRNGLSLIMDTETRTYTNTESSDSDRDRTSLQMLLDTTTLTESRESSDQDR